MPSLRRAVGPAERGGDDLLLLVDIDADVEPGDYRDPERTEIDAGDLVGWLVALVIRPGRHLGLGVPAHLPRRRGVELRAFGTLFVAASH
jgi:hypothetical protein